jgi:drug/metabolite transporter (DMT)-like permease
VAGSTEDRPLSTTATDTNLSGRLRTFVQASARWHGVWWILFASTSFSAMGAMIKAAVPELSTAQVVFWRCVVVFAVAHLIVRRNRVSLRPGHLPRMAVRCGVGLMAMLCFFGSMSHLPLGTATALQYTSPLFTVLLAGPLLGEWAGRRGWALVGLAFVGVILILRPAVDVGFGALGLGLLGGILAAWVYVVVRQLRETDPPSRIIWWFALTSAVATAPFALGDGLPQGPGMWALALGIGLAATGGQFGMTQAYRVEKATVVGPLSYATVVLSALAGVLFFGDRLDLFTGLGIVVFVTAGARLSAGAGR